MPGDIVAYRLRDRPGRLGLWALPARRKSRYPRRMRHFFALLVLPLLAAVPASAAWQSLSASDFEVPPPPAPGSPGDRQDFATLFSLQAARTPQQCSVAASMPVPD